MEHNDCGYDEGCCNECCNCECHGPSEPEPAIKGPWEGPLLYEHSYGLHNMMRSLNNSLYRTYAAKDYSKLVPSWMSITKAVPDAEDVCE